VEVLDAMKANEPKPGEPNKLFTDYTGGGFAIFHTPGYKVFVDDRCEVFGGDWLDKFMKAAEKDTGCAIAKWEAEYGQFNFALTKPGTNFDNYFRSSTEWECVKSTENASFYKRKKPEVFVIGSTPSW
jgi:hypothetical protein